MAQWWELAIPAAAGVAGGWGAAWWQGRVSLRLFKQQAAHERHVRTLDDRRAAYARMLAAARQTRLTMDAFLRANASLDSASDKVPEIATARKEVAGEHARSFQSATDELLACWTVLRVSAPLAVIAAAELAEAASTERTSYEQYQASVEAFSTAVRSDLGIG
jgi:hypothetical protein